jgi:ribonuclease BN (tRNA processing enzyme)
LSREERPGRFVVVGCGTVVPEAETACSCYWVELQGMRALLDCGPGAVQALARLRLPWSQVTHLIITHFHADHVGALPGLFFSLKHGIESHREAPLEVWGPPGTRSLFQGLAATLGDFLLDPGFPVHLRELAPGDTTTLGDVRLLSHKTPHTPESQAIRLEASGTSLTYSGDSGPDDVLAEFARDSQLFVCECSLPDDAAADNHLSPGRVARLASMARVENLLLTHLYPRLRAEHDVRALVAAAGYGGRVSVAHEGWSCELGR